MVSKAWKSLSPEGRSTWEVKAQNDRTRYDYEKAMYTGPWKDISAGGRKSKNKDPLKPKRPMSTFLAFSAANRKCVQKQYPKKKNSDISVILGEMWTETPQSERQIYIDVEQKLRKAYNASSAKWRAKVAKDDADKRQTRETRALQMALAQKNGETADTGAQDESQHPFSDVFDTTQSVFPSVMTSHSYHPTYVYPQTIPNVATGLPLPTGEGYVNPNEQGHNIIMSSHYDNKASITKWRAKVAKYDAVKQQTRENRALQMALAQKNGQTAETGAQDESQHPFSDVIATTQSVFSSGMIPPYHPTYDYPQTIPNFATGLPLPTGEGYMHPNEQGHNSKMSSHYDNSMAQGEFDIVYNLLVRLHT
eukprot:scaffold68934_cov47-Attheya_sp.AAC.4